MINIESYIKDVPNFPKEGIVFKDITPLLNAPDAFKETINRMAELIPQSCTHVAGIESRGFLFASALAFKLGLSFTLIRKPGKLPRSTFSQKYSLEYGEDELQVHNEDLSEEDKVVIVDDVLATGGTACAAEKLIESTGAKVESLLFLMELAFLNGQEELKSPFHSLVKY